MKTLKRFDLLFKQICQEIQTYNDKPGFPGGNNCKHSDSGSITGNCCKEYNTDPGSVTCNCCKEFSTDAGNVGGKTDGIVGICQQDYNFEGFKFPVDQTVFVYDFKSNISSNEFNSNENIRTGIIRSRKTFNGTNFYSIEFPDASVLFSFPQWKLGYTPKEAKLNYYNSISSNSEITQDACAGPAAMGTVNVMGPTPGMPSIADTAGGSRAAQKAPSDPGVTTKDVSQIYSPSLNKAPKAQKQKKQKYPLFSRLKK